MKNTFFAKFINIIVSVFFPSLLCAQWSDRPDTNTAICSAANNQSNPLIVNDDAGGAIIVWEDYRNGKKWDIYVEKVNASGLEQWTANGVQLGASADPFDLY